MEIVNGFVCMNCTDVDPECDMKNLVVNTPKNHGNVNTILNNSFGMLGINSVVIVSKI